LDKNSGNSSKIILDNNKPGVEPVEYEPAKILASYSTFRLEKLMVDEVFTAKEVKI